MIPTAGLDGQTLSWRDGLWAQARPGDRIFAPETSQTTDNSKLGKSSGGLPSLSGAPVPQTLDVMEWRKFFGDQEEAGVSYEPYGDILEPQDLLTVEFRDTKPSTTATTRETQEKPIFTLADWGLGGIEQYSFVCKFPGCTAPPFETRYLLDSHAETHSPPRPYFCAVKGCPRGEGGKGFMHKADMIRHGLVHDRPEFVCPWCSGRQQRYTRRDNLMRFVSPLQLIPVSSRAPLADVLVLKTCASSPRRQRQR